MIYGHQSNVKYVVIISEVESMLVAVRYLALILSMQASIPLTLPFCSKFCQMYNLPPIDKTQNETNE